MNKNNVLFFIIQQGKHEINISMDGANASTVEKFAGTDGKIAGMDEKFASTDGKIASMVEKIAGTDGKIANKVIVRATK